MIYNYTRCESVIAKIMADLDSTEVRNRTTDIKEWIFEAVDKIGAPMQYIRREGGTKDFPLLKIQDNQVPLPNDLVVLDGVAYSESKDGPWRPMVIATSVFREPTQAKAVDDSSHEPMQYKPIQSISQLYTYNNMRLFEKAVGNNVDKAQYFIKPGWLVTNKSKGFVKLAYKAIAVDERGYPLIPDLTSYQEAIYWYVVMKLSFSKWMKGTLGGKGVNAGQNMYTYMQQQWNFYRNQAYAEAMMPTADEMKAIKNSWHQLIPDINADDTFFEHQNEQEINYNDYYYGY